MQEERIWPRPAVFLHFLELKKKYIYNLERKGISQADLFEESFTERWRDWDKVSCHLVTTHTADLYFCFLSILLLSQKKKKKGFWQKALLSLEGGSQSKSTRGAKLH